MEAKESKSSSLTAQAIIAGYTTNKPKSKGYSDRLSSIAPQVIRMYRDDHAEIESIKSQYSINNYELYLILEKARVPLRQIRGVNRVSSYQIAKMRKMRREGYSLNEIAKLTGLHYTTVSRHVQTVKLPAKAEQKPAKAKPVAKAQPQIIMIERPSLWQRIKGWFS